MNSLHDRYIFLSLMLCSIPLPIAALTVLVAGCFFVCFRIRQTNRNRRTGDCRNHPRHRWRHDPGRSETLATTDNGSLCADARHRSARVKIGLLTTRDAGRQARAALASLTSAQGEIQLTHISGDKYFGRVVADISFSDGRNPAQEMLSAGYVSPYNGGRKSKSCSPR
ncbi:hypothetical protein [Pararhizobium sp. PWRC1-1]|uniref:hypothetical protein n=1 Tax=Pararhizobium sp. PWRC1-1 TaxID=2804566 RepID=UPI003CF8E1E2